MGTRGTWGFHKNGEDKLTYNHFDSYPEGLGVAMLEFCQKNTVETMNTVFDKIIMVDERTSTPTEEEKEHYMCYFKEVSTKSPDDWYALLRETQGQPQVYVDHLELKHMIDNRDFIKESLWCEWGYVINLSTKMFEIYKGFNHEPNKSRYCNGEIPFPEDISRRENPSYYPCRLLMEISFEELKDMSKGEFLKKVNEIAYPEEGDDE